jgi:PAS domain S-box-containing protein
MKNKLNFYTELISSILDSCCTYVVIIENVDIELISFYGNNPFDLDTLRLVVRNFDTSKKSFSITDVKDFKTTIENEIFSSKNLSSIGYLPILDENKITIGYLITSFDKPFSILENQEKTISLISNKIFQKLRKNKREKQFHIANNELLSQTVQETELVAELMRANKELTFQNAEKEKRANELIIANQELAFQIQEQEKRAAELLIANLEIDFLHQEEHALFASIVDSSDDAMVSKRLDGIITSWNHGAEKIFGYSAAEIIGKSIATLIPPQLQQEEVGIIEKIKNGETISNLKTQRVRKDGTIFYSALTISPIKNLDGIVFGASKVLRDITEQYNSEAEKNQLAERLRLATQSAQIAVWDWDLETNKLASDEGMYKLYGIASEDFNSVYDGWMSIIHDEDRQRVADELQLAISNKKDYNTEFRVVWNDSSIHFIKATGTVSWDDVGNAIRMIGVNWDITEQKEKEQHLKLLESVITNTTDSVLITEAEPFDEPGPRILYVNEAFTKMTGYTAAEVIGKTPRILQGPKSDKAELKRLGEALRKWETCEITTINYKKNGEEFWINFSVIPVANEKGWYTHWIAIERDVTIRKNEELQNQLFADINAIFSEPLKLHETLDRTLRFISNFGDFCFAEAWLTSTNKNVLNKISSHATTENVRLFLEETKSIDTIIYGEGFAGIVAKTKEINIWGDLANREQFLRQDDAIKYGLKTKIGLPLLYNNEVIGVLVFGLDYEVVDTTKYTTLFKKLGDYLGPEIKRKQLELELNQMFNFAPDLIVVIGLDGCFNRVNPATCQLLGYTQKELCSEPYVNFIHPEDKEKSTNEIATLLETNLTYYFENRYVTKSGKIKWLAWNAIYVSEDNSIYAVAKDITDKKELENLFKKTNELARIGGWEFDLQNNTILWSDITKEIHEVAPNYLPDLETAIDFYKEGSTRTRITEYVQQAISTGKSYDDEFQIVTAKGNERWVRAIGEAEFVNGNCIRIYGSFQDITERKKAEIKLIENEDYLRTILDNEPECVKVLNSKGELVSMNPAGLAMIEADDEQQVVGQRMMDLVNKEYQIGFSQLSASVFKGNPGTFEFEITGLKGSQRWLETHAVPLKDTTGKIVNLLGVTRDITERKANESKLILLNENLNKQKAELVTSNKELEQFAYVASHDLQEPLRMVTSFLSLLEKRYIGVLDEKGLSYINFAVDGAKRMRQIILDILEFSRINTNHDGNYESVDLKQIIDEISLLQSKLIKEKEAKIIFEELPKVHAIRHYIVQLFQNIISNALKYSKEDIPLQIIIKSEEFDGFYQIAITDNGIGIEQEYFEKIFIIFQRLHGKEKYEGNGMGLAIVKKIVDKLNGKIWVESQIGVGSTFYINIPKKN